jgi:hypothetical protein
MSKPPEISERPVAESSTRIGRRHSPPQETEQDPYRRRRVLLALALAALAVAVLKGLPRLFYDDVIWELNGWFVPYDLTIFLRAGDAVLDGTSPYPAVDALRDDTQYVYPPFVALLMVPLAVLPVGAAASVFAWLSLAAIAGALRLFGVRDWRCYVVVLLSPLVHEALRWGTISPFMLLLVAVCWRWRDDLRGAAAAGTAAVSKLFLWPLGAWLALTGRLRNALLAALGAALAALASWAVIGFAGLADYPELLRKLDGIAAAESYSVYAIGRTLGLGATEARALAVVLGAVLLLLALRAARAEGDDARTRDRRSLTLALAAALVMSPIVWLHYLVLLFAPIALARPRLSPLWLLPLTLWPFMAVGWFGDWPAGNVEELAVAGALVVAVFAAAVGGRPRVLGYRLPPWPTSG